MSRIEVVSSEQLSSGDRKKIERFFAEKHGEEVLAEYFVDGELIGGVIVRDGDRVYDGSVASQLVSVKRKLLQE